MYIHENNILTAGIPLNEAKSAVIFLHGRGSSAEDIISLSRHLDIKYAAIFAPQAINNSWYPFSFIAPVEQNQPALDSALTVLKTLVDQIVASGIPLDRIFFCGFSQGACLTLEYVTRNAGRYGGVAAFTGGLIGREINMKNYKGDFAKTPVLITTGDPDPHVPVRRVELTETIMKKLNADVTTKIYAGRVHTISPKEIELAKSLIFKNI
ncbi:alpha/beta hydrolase [Pedobacter frigoris]|uniref:Phospholipase n=1 Tax=Pedobacter frigoris TaxID=2571272 RepID=A0A4U1CMS1_9SPHI|nr:dienelactone hydrolase family protein [Pedobacter frigoris]TKC09187.1 phospholipase [Pedobacter frigoris]